MTGGNKISPLSMLTAADAKVRERNGCHSERQPLASRAVLLWARREANMVTVKYMRSGTESGVKENTL